MRIIKRILGIISGSTTNSESSEKIKHFHADKLPVYIIISISLLCTLKFLLTEVKLGVPEILLIINGIITYKFARIGYANIARHLLITGLNIFLFYLCTAAGLQNGFQLLYFPLMAFSLLLFNKKNYWSSLPTIATSLVLLFLLEHFYAAQNSDRTIITELCYSVLLLFSASLTFGLLIYFMKILSDSNKISGKNSASLLSIIENTSDAIVLLNSNWRTSEFNTIFHHWHHTITGQDITRDSNVYDTLKLLEPFSEGITKKWVKYINKAFSGESFTVLESFLFSNIKYIIEIQFNPVNEGRHASGVCLFFRNKTKQALHQKSLELGLEENKRQAIIANKTDNAIIITDTKFRIEWANESFARLSGFTITDCIGRRSQDILNETYSENLDLLSFESKLSGRNAITIESVCITADNDKKWISSNITPVYNERGACENFIIIKSDITVLKKQEEKLHQAYAETRKMALVAENSDISVLIIDKNSKVEWVNAGFEKFFGFTSEYCIGRTPFKFLFGALTSKKMVSNFEENIKSARNFTQEIITYTSNQECRWVCFNVTPFFNDKDELEKYICIISDITASKKQEVEIRRLLTQDKERIWINSGLAELGDVLRNNQESVSTLFNKTLEFLSSYTGTHHLQIASIPTNEVIKDEKILLATFGLPYIMDKCNGGYPVKNNIILNNNFIICQDADMATYKQTMDGNSNNLCEILSLKIREIENCILVLLLYSSKKFSPLQQEFLKRASINISQTVELVLKKQETDTLLIETQDLNLQLKKSEEELQNTIHELHNQSEKLKQSQQDLQIQNSNLNEKTHALEIAREALQLKALQFEQSNKFKSEFLANMSHELRTPLNSIIILSRLLFENKENTLTAKQLDFARVVNKSGDDLLSLINNILDLSKIEAGKIELEFDKTSIHEVAEDMLSLFNEVAREKKINFTTLVDADVPETFITDSVRLGQILKNLLSNAFKFTPANGSVTLHIIRSNGYIDFEVSDSGTGIAEDKLHLIFEAFRQADGSINRKYGGTGLGLSISKELTSMLNGFMNVSSVPDNGSTFTLSLPLNEETSGNADQNKTKLTALIVEDNEMENFAIRNVLQKQGYNCLTAFGISEAMELLSANKVHALILDLNLPDGNGEEVLKYVKESPYYTDISIIIYTNSDLTRQENELLESYSNLVIKKENKSILTLQQETLHFLQSRSKMKTESSKTSVISPEQILQLKGKNILIVDDDERNIYALSNTLEGKDMNIFSATNGMDALEKLQLFPEIDLILMDVMMPEMDGMATTKIIRSKNNNKHIPIIAVTAKAMKDDREMCMKAGMDEYVTKPIDTNQLLLVMNSFFE
jgi:PAS domain S-box-containing protein